jgi:hypothetical protein
MLSKTLPFALRTSLRSCQKSSLYSLGAAPTENTALLLCVGTLLQRYIYLTTENTPLLLLLVFAFTGIFLPSRCLAVIRSGFQAPCYNIVTIWGRFCVTYKTGSELAHWIYWHLIHTVRDHRQYSATADLHTSQFTVTHTLGFSVFTSRILATDL